MHKFLTVLLALASWPVHAGISVEPIDLGLVTPGQQVRFEAKLSNTSDSEIVLDTLVSAEWHTLAIAELPVRLAANAVTVVMVSGELRAPIGRRSFPMILSSSETNHSTRISPTALVYSAIDPQEPSVDLGIIEAGESDEAKLELSSREINDFMVLSVAGATDHLNTRIDESGRTLHLSTRDDLPWGLYNGTVELNIDSERQRLVLLPYSFEVRGSVVPSRFQVEFGVGRLGEHQPQSLFLRTADGSRLRVGRPIVDGDPVIVRRGHCPEKSRSCADFRFEVPSDAAIGRTAGRVGFPIRGTSQVLWVEYGAVVFAPGTKIVNVNEEMLTQPADRLPVRSALHEISTASAVIHAPLPPGDGPLLKWRVRHERSIHSYRVYRSDSEDDAMELVSSAPILTLSLNEERPIEYAWRDVTAEPGRTYWYQIGYIDIAGRRIDLTQRSAVSVAAK